MLESVTNNIINLSCLSVSTFLHFSYIFQYQFSTTMREFSVCHFFRCYLWTRRSVGEAGKWAYAVFTSYFIHSHSLQKNIYLYIEKWNDELAALWKYFSVHFKCGCGKRMFQARFKCLWFFSSSSSPLAKRDSSCMLCCCCDQWKYTYFICSLLSLHVSLCVSWGFNVKMKMERANLYWIYFIHKDSFKKLLYFQPPKNLLFFSFGYEINIYWMKFHFHSFSGMVFLLWKYFSSKNCQKRLNFVIILIGRIEFSS